MNLNTRPFLSGLYGLTLAVTILGLTAGCTGPKGDTGTCVDEVDLVAPTITLLEPSGNDTIRTSERLFRAEAHDDQGLAYVEFYVDGSNQISTDSTAHDSISPYEVNWSFAEGSLREGLHLLMARAVDRSGNVAYTPVTPFYLYLTFGRQVLRYDTEGVEGYLALPDEFLDRYWNVRFSPHRACTLIALQFAWADPLVFGFDGAPELVDLFVWDSEGNLPVTMRDSLRISTDTLDYSTWTEIDLSDRNLTFDGDFHGGWSPAFELYTQYADSNWALPLSILDNSDHMLKEPEKHRSVEFDPSTGWGTVQQHYSVRYDFGIRAVVDYGDGTSAVLTPSGPDSELRAISVLPRR